MDMVPLAEHPAPNSAIIVPMETDLFLHWLIEKRGLALKAAQDAVSRCKRIESVLGQKLEKAVASQAAFDMAITALWRSLPRRGDLMYAMRLYAAFRSPKLNARKKAFYGDEVRGLQKAAMEPRC